MNIFFPIDMESSGTAKQKMAFYSHMEITALSDNRCIAVDGNIVSEDNKTFSLPPPEATNIQSGNMTIHIEAYIDKWTEKEETRFDKLAELFALESISAEEKQELDMLSTSRRHLHHPRSSSEILWELQQRKKIGNLLKALQEYVKFVNPPHFAR